MSARSIANRIAVDLLGFVFKKSLKRFLKYFLNHYNEYCQHKGDTDSYVEILQNSSCKYYIRVIQEYYLGVLLIYSHECQTPLRLNRPATFC